MITRGRLALIIALLGVAAYFPILHLPFISDDYTQIALARQWGNEWWTPVWSHPELLTRFTYLLLSYSLDHVFGFLPLPFYALSLILHVLCSLLVLASGSIRIIGWRVSFFAACFFAVYEGHQEAVMWVAASMELLLFLFGFGAVLLWHRWLRTGKAKWYWFSFASFLLAVLSKESVWIFPALMLLLALIDQYPRKRAILGLLPYATVTLVYVVLVAESSAINGRFSDGSFSLQGHWPLILVHSFWHILIIWGILALGVIAWFRDKLSSRIVILSCSWIILSLIPYSFLTYMLRVPSRQTYLASAGLAWLVGYAFLRLRRRFPRASIAVVALLILLVNCEILWVKKLSQFQERAQPTELLKSAALDSAGDAIHINCAPVSPLIVTALLRNYHLAAIFDRQRTDADPHCFSIWYVSKTGSRTFVYKQLADQKHSWLR